MKKTYSKPVTKIDNLMSFGYLSEGASVGSGGATNNFGGGDAKKRVVESDGFYNGFKDDVFEDDF